MITQARWRGTGKVKYLNCVYCGQERNVSLQQKIPPTGYECNDCATKRKRANRTAIRQAQR